MVLESLEERAQCGMELVGSGSGFAGIWLAQVGEPLAHRQENFAHCIISDGFLGFVEPEVAVPQSEDEEVGKLVFLRVDRIEG